MNGNIPVTNGLYFQGLQNGRWAEQLLPGVYPLNTLFPVIPDSARTFLSGNDSGAQAADPRAVGTIENASIRLVPGNADMFTKTNLTGGSVFNAPMSAKIGFFAALGLVALGLYWLFKR